MNNKLYAFFLIGLICCTFILGYGLKQLYQPTNESSSQHGLLKQNNDNSDMITFLQQYIKIDTAHPTPNYRKALDFLKEYAQRDGFLYTEVLLSSGNPVGIITLQGTDNSLPALVLNHHMDVVPAPNKDEWSVDPFAGSIIDNKLIGRGAQDMKGIAALHYYALKSLKKANITPKRTIHLFAVPDEEIGGYSGTKLFIETDEFKQLGVGYVLDEGHASGTKGMLDLKISERKPLQITVRCQGSLSHGSHLMCFNAIHELIAFLHRITTLHHEQQEKAAHAQPGQLLSLNVTSLTAGVKKDNEHIALNIVPQYAQATIDIRIPPTMKIAEVKALLEIELTAFKNMSYTIEAQAYDKQPLNNYRTQLYKALQKSIHKRGLEAQPHYFEGASDLRFYLDIGIEGIGLTPFTIEDDIHGTNESVPVEELTQGKKIIEQFLKDFCY